MTDFTFPTEKRLSRLTLGRVEQLNALFAEIATASATKVEFTLGNVDLNGGRATNAANGVNPTDLVTKQQLDATAFAPALPGQTGNAGKFITTNGTVASWVDAPVRFDIAQLLTAPQQAQARANIAAAGSTETTNALATKADATATALALSSKAEASDVALALASKASLTGAETLTNKTLTQPTIILKQSTSPSQTAEGAIEWDTDDDALVVGTGSGRKIYRPTSFETVATIDITSSTASQDVAIPSWARQLRITGYGRPETSSASILLRVAVGGVFNSTAGAYQFQFNRADRTTVDAARDATTQTGFNLLPGSNNGSNGGGNFNFLLNEVNQLRHKYASNVNAYLSPGGNIIQLSSAFVFVSSSPLTDLRLLASSGNIAVLHAVIEASR